MAVWELLDATNQQAASIRPLLLRGGHTATQVGAKILVVAGRKGSRFWGDLLSYCTQTQAWEVLQPALPFGARANHHAVLVGHRHLWVLGGADETTIFGDVWVLDTQTMKWTQALLSGDTNLLIRCSAGVDLHPTQPHLILMFGGYGLPVPGSAEPNHYNDLVCLNTLTGEVSALRPSGTPPAARCFHSFTTVGNRCWVVGGRIANQGSLVGDDIVAVYDTEHNTWLQCTNTEVVEGRHRGHTLPTPVQGRTSHKAVVVGDRLLVTGGTLGMEAPLAVWLQLSTRKSMRPSVLEFQWSRADLPSAVDSGQEPQARAAHGACRIQNRVYLMLGYTSGPTTKAYLPDVLTLKLPTSALTPKAKAKAARGTGHQGHTHMVARAVGTWDAATGERHVQASVTQVQVAAGDIPAAVAPAAHSPARFTANGHAGRRGGSGGGGGRSPGPQGAPGVQQGAVTPSGVRGTGAVAAPGSGPGSKQVPRRPSDAAAQALTPTKTVPAAAKARAQSATALLPGGAQPAAGHRASKRPLSPAEDAVDLTHTDDEEHVADGGGGDGVGGRGGGVQGPPANGAADGGGGWQRKRQKADNGGRGVHGVHTLVAPPSANPRDVAAAPGLVGAPGDSSPSGEYVPDSQDPSQPQRQRPVEGSLLKPPQHLAQPAVQLAGAGCPHHTCSSPVRHAQNAACVEQSQVRHREQSQVHVLQQQVADLQLQLTRLQQSELLARSRADLDRQSLEHLRSALGDMRASLAHKTRELSSTEMELREAQKQANSVTLQHQSLVSEKNQWLMEKQRLVREEATMKTRYQELESKVKTLESTLERSQSDMQHTVSQWEQRLASKDSALSDQSSRITSLLSSLEAVRADNARLLEGQHRMGRELTECREALSEAQRSAAVQQERAQTREAELRHTLDVRSAELRDAQQQNEFLRAELEACRARTSQLETELTVSRQSASTAEATCQQLRHQLAALQATTHQAAVTLTEDLKKRKEDMQRALEEAQRSMDLFSSTVATQLPGPSNPQG